MNRRLPTDAVEDPWADWLLDSRSAGDPQYELRIQARVAQFVERALQPLLLHQAASLLDFGCGDGALGLRALQRWPGVQVVFADTSAELLRRASERAQAAGVYPRCRFVPLAGGGLAAVADQSLDAVATRAALAYVPDKPLALAEFHRVLRPGSTLSLAEPVFRDEALASCAERSALDAAGDGGEGGEAARLLGLLHRWRARQFPDTPEELAACSHCNFSERDLYAWTLGAGFAHAHLELHIDCGPSLAPDWDSFSRHTPHPFATSLRDVLDWECTPQEAQLLEGLLRQTWEQGQMNAVERMAYLVARRP